MFKQLCHISQRTYHSKRGQLREEEYSSKDLINLQFEELTKDTSHAEWWVKLVYASSSLAIMVREAKQKIV